MTSSPHSTVSISWYLFLQLAESSLGLRSVISLTVSDQAEDTEPGEQAEANSWPASPGHTGSQQSTFCPIFSRGKTVLCKTTNLSQCNICVCGQREKEKYLIGNEKLNVDCLPDGADCIVSSLSAVSSLISRCLIWSLASLSWLSVSSIRWQQVRLPQLPPD